MARFVEKARSVEIYSFLPFEGSVYNKGSSGGASLPACLRGSSRRLSGVEKVLEDGRGGDGVATLALLLMRQAGAAHLSVGGVGGQALVDEVDGEAGALLQGVAELSGFFGGGAFRAVHVSWQAQHERIGPLLFNGLFDGSEAHFRVGGFDDRQRRGNAGDVVAHRQAGALLAGIDRHVSHG